jgi:hypothetical protein
MFLYTFINLETTADRLQPLEILVDSELAAFAHADPAGETVTHRLHAWHTWARPTGASRMITILGAVPVYRVIFYPVQLPDYQWSVVCPRKKWN